MNLHFFSAGYKPLYAEAKCYMITKEQRQLDIENSIKEYIITGEAWRCLANDYFKDEEWRGVQGWEDKYQVSNYARLRSIKIYLKDNREALFKEPYIMKQFIGSTGYLNLQLRGRTGKNKRLKIHRVVAMAFNPNPNNLKIVNHLDWNKLNNLPNNLQWSTKKEDVNHAFDNGLIGRGEKSYEATITNDIALSIFNDTGKYRQIAEKYSVSYYMVSSIKNGFSWSSVTGKIHKSRTKK